MGCVLNIYFIKQTEDQAEKAAETEGPGAVVGSAPTTPHATKKRNPHKHLLYRPTAAQLLMFAATVMKELYEGKALLLYLCGDGLGSPRVSTPPASSSSSSSDSSNDTNNNNNNNNNTTTNNNTNIEAQQPELPINQTYSADGLAMNIGRPDRSRSLSFTSPRGHEASANPSGFLGNPSHLSDAIYPEDIRPFTRRPLFLIIDSDSSFSFKVNETKLFSLLFFCCLSLY